MLLHAAEMQPGCSGMQRFAAGMQRDAAGKHWEGIRNRVTTAPAFIFAQAAQQWQREARRLHARSATAEAEGRVRRGV
eukprot:gene3199-6671_t